MTPRRSTLRAAATRAEPSTPAPGSTALNTKPIRISVDLDPALWGDLQSWLTDYQVRTRRKINQVDVVRALISLLARNDEYVSDQVRQELK